MDMSILKISIGLLAGLVVSAGSDLRTHEWGTFTSVAREDGTAVEWAPLLGPGDLPCFVTRADHVYKAAARGLVRMETPVLYFYSQQPATLSVHVDFPKGVITEWYPNPAPNTLPNNGTSVGTGMDWKQVQVTPGKDLEYPLTQGASHYYAARNTDAAPLRIGGQQEKMIFYRGLGYFEPPLQARYESETRLEVRNAGKEPIPLVIAFENHHGRIGFRIAENVTEPVTMDAPELTQDVAAIRKTFFTSLTRLGLYPKEANAMLDTWADSWFNEGARVFYIVPRALVDSLLPLTIVPAPQEIERVFVGRLEILSPQTKHTIEHALRAGDEETLTEFGRFLEPFTTQIQRADKGFVLSPEAQRYLGAIANGSSVGGNGYGPPPEPASCVE